MGAGGSKPAGAAAASRQVFTSDTPVQFSHELVESLQSSSESDASRAQTLELHIQNRVAAELERIRSRESQTLADLEKRLADDTKKNLSTGQKKTSTTSTIQPSLSLDAPRVPFAGPESAAAQGSVQQVEGGAGVGAVAPRQDLNSAQVREDIEALKKRIAERQKIKDADAGVEKARGEVIQCLTANEKRPLNCWREVESFKKEVGRLEKDWVEKVIG